MTKFTSFSMSTLSVLVALVALLVAPAAAFVPRNIHQPSPTQLFVEKGTVKWFDQTKGFGFITNNDSGDDHFVHQTDIQAEGFRSLDDGASVEYELTEENGKTKAINVTGPGGEKIPRGFAYKQGDD